MIEVVDDPELQDLRKDLTTFTHRAILPTRFPGEKIPELQDLEETQIMLAERAATWPDQWMAEGYNQGLQEGRKEGRKQGRQEGRNSGRLEGQRLALVALAETKFGVLEAKHTDLIAKASAEQLGQWLASILTATKPEDFLST